MQRMLQQPSMGRVLVMIAEEMCRPCCSMLQPAVGSKAQAHTLLLPGHASCTLFQHWCAACCHTLWWNACAGDPAACGRV